MKTIPVLLAIGATLFTANARAQVVLQDFSATTGPNTFFHGTWELTGASGGSNSANGNFVQGAGVFDITGTTGIVPTNDASSYVEFFFTPGLSIGANTFLSVRAQTLGTNIAPSFAVTLVDTGGATAFATFSAVDFVTGVYTTVTSQLTLNSGFLPTSIDSFRISGNQPGGSDRFNISFDNVSAVSAVPEPATSALLAGIFVLGFVAWRRHRTARAT